MLLQFVLALCTSEKCFCNLRWHFAKMKNASANCARITQIHSLSESIFVCRIESHTQMGLNFHLKNGTNTR